MMATKMMAIETTTELTIKIARDFTRTPGPRHEKFGKFSGERFRNELLEPMFLKAREAKTKIFIDLDDTAGYGTSFLEEAFGGLARLYSPQEVLEHIKIKTDDEPLLDEDITRYITEATKAKQ